MADLGCGRGTFLELLRQRGATGLGVDLSDEAVGLSRAKGFAIEQQDAIDFLTSRENELDGVFASHIVEHLPIDRAVMLVPAAHVALKAGGYMIVVTPNPADLRVITGHSGSIQIMSDRIHSPWFVDGSLPRVST